MTKIDDLRSKLAILDAAYESAENFELESIIEDLRRDALKSLEDAERALMVPAAPQRESEQDAGRTARRRVHR